MAPNFVKILSRKHFEMSSFRLNNSFRLQKRKQGCQTLKPTSKKPFHHVSRDKILHDSWSISAALARGFSDRHFERGEGPGDEVE